jgi:hypothetical protein
MSDMLIKHNDEAILCISLDNRGNSISFHTKISSEMFECSENRQAELNEPSHAKCCLQSTCTSWFKMPKLGKVIICTVLVAILNSHVFRVPYAFNSGTEGLSMNFCMKMHLEKRDEDMTQVRYPFVMPVFNTQIRVGVVMNIMQLNSHVGF